MTTQKVHKSTFAKVFVMNVCIGLHVVDCAVDLIIT